MCTCTGKEVRGMLYQCGITREQGMGWEQHCGVVGK